MAEPFDPMSAGMPTFIAAPQFDLLGLALLLAIASCWLVLLLGSLARQGMLVRERQLALGSAAAVLAIGLWGAQWVGLLAMVPALAVHFNPLFGGIALLPGLAASALAFFLLTRKRLSWSEIFGGGVLVAIGLVCMNLGSMYAVRLLPLARGWLAAACALSIILATLALAARFLFSRWVENWRGIVLGGLLMGLALAAIGGLLLLAGQPAQPSGSVAPAGESRYLAIDVVLAAFVLMLLAAATNMALYYRRMFYQVNQHEQRLRALVDTAIDGIVTIDAYGIVRSFNKAAELIFGWPADAVVGRNVNMLMPEPYHSEHDGYLRHYQKTGQARIIGIGREVVGRRQDGSELPLRLAIGRMDFIGETLFVGFLTDISEQRRMEQMLRDSERQYRSLIANIPGVAFRCYCDEARHMLFVGDAIERLSGHKSRELTNGTLGYRELIHPDDRSAVAAQIADALSLGRNYVVEYRICHSDGSSHWVSETAGGVRDRNGDLAWIDGVIVDITESKLRNAEFESMATAVDRMLAVKELSMDGHIVKVNANYLAATGYSSAAELVGKTHASQCAPAELRDGAYDQLWAKLRAGQAHSGEFHRLAHDGSEVMFRVWYSPVIDADGKPLRVIALGTDLSGRFAMEQELRRAKERAEQAAAARSTFLANMSHEIRTPMNAVIGFTELLLNSEIDASQRHHLNTIGQAARSLRGLINNILDMAKLDKGMVELESDDFSLRALCREIIDSQLLTARAKGLALVVDYPDELPEFFRGDALRLRQILLNLVGNAIKFTEKGSVTLRVRRDGGQVALAVCDTGIGIPADRLARIFDPFAQADASTTRRFGGTGLGTTIARQLAELMGGSITVDSRVGVGSAFLVRLPLPLGEPVKAIEESGVSLPPLRILVADDVPENLELLDIALRRDGHQVVLAHDGVETLQAICREHFDVVLMDVHMPHVDGMQTTQMIRVGEQVAGTKRLPVIALTASVLEEDYRAARAAGMDGFAGKPVELPSLYREIARVLGLQGVATAHRPLVPLLSDAVIDWQRGEALWGERAVLAEAIGEFLDAHESNCARLGDLLIAGRQADAMAVAHRIRGAAGNLCLAATSAAAGQLEDALRADRQDAAAGLIDELRHALAAVRSELDCRPLPLSAAGAAVPLAGGEARILLGEVAAALARGEVPETALARLGAAWSDERVAALRRAVDQFDFDAAFVVLEQLQNIIDEENP